MRGEDQERLKVIKLGYVLFPTMCDCCEEKYSKVKMWKFYRYGYNMRRFKWHYCTNCMATAEDVIKEIDSDEYPFGLVGFDNFIIPKKDSSRMKSMIYKACEAITRYSQE